MTQLFDNPAALLRRMSTADSRWPIYLCAIDELGCVDARTKNNLLVQLDVIATKYLVFAGGTVNAGRIRESIEQARKACAMLAEVRETWLHAWQHSPISEPELREKMHQLHVDGTRALLPEVDLLDWDGRDPGQAPFRGEFSRRAFNLGRLADRLDLANLDIPARTATAAFQELIGRLGSIYEEVSGELPRAPRKSTDPLYRGPFSRFVAAFWPAVCDDTPPSNRRIAAALDAITVGTAS